MVTKYNADKVSVTPVTPVDERRVYTEKAPVATLKLADMLAGLEAIIKAERLTA